MDHVVDFLAAGTVGLQLALLATLAEAVRRRNVAAVVNAAVALLVAMLPSLFGYVITDPPDFGTAVTLWLAAAAFLHSLGMLGLYESIRWWDHVTHTVSAALVAALVYAGITVTASASDGVTLSSAGIGAVTLLFTLAVGVFWELLELVAREVGDRFGVEPVLVHYGWRDTVLDLSFDVVGALFVLALDLHLFLPVAGRYPSMTRLVVIASFGIVVLGSVFMAVGLRVGSVPDPDE